MSAGARLSGLASRSSATGVASSSRWATACSPRRSTQPRDQQRARHPRRHPQPRPGNPRRVTRRRVRTPRDEDVGGLAIHVGARISSIARPGEVLVRSTVRELSIGSGQTFTDCGELDLKGVPGPWRILAVETWGTPPLLLPMQSRGAGPGHAAVELRHRAERTQATRRTSVNRPQTRRNPRVTRGSVQWSQPGSNRRPPACKAGTRTAPRLGIPVPDGESSQTDVLGCARM